MSGETPLTGEDVAELRMWAQGINPRRPQSARPHIFDASCPWCCDSRHETALALLDAAEAVPRLQAELAAAKHNLGEKMDQAAVHYGGVIHSLEAELAAASELVRRADAIIAAHSVVVVSQRTLDWLNDAYPIVAAQSPPATDRKGE